MTGTQEVPLAHIESLANTILQNSDVDHSDSVSYDEWVQFCVYSPDVSTYFKHCDNLCRFIKAPKKKKIKVEAPLPSCATATTGHKSKSSPNRNISNTHNINNNKNNKKPSPIDVSYSIDKKSQVMKLNHAPTPPKSTSPTKPPIARQKAKQSNGEADGGGKKKPQGNATMPDTRLLKDIFNGLDR